MSVLDFAENARFTCVVASRLAASPSVRWNNTYELQAQVAGTYDELVVAAEALASFHQLMTFSSIETEEIRVSTWQPDSHPYDPSAFFIQPVHGTGAISTIGIEPLPLKDVLFIERVVTIGRQGKLFLRGALAKTDVTGTYDKWQLSAPGSIASRMEDAIETSGLDTMFRGGASTTGIRLNLINLAGETIVNRPVESFAVSGVASVKLNHKYFDKAP